MRVGWRVVGVGVLVLGTAAGAVEPEHPLIDAVRAGDLAAAHALVRGGADVNRPQADGTTALHWAARADHVELLALLLDAGAAVDAANRYGVTPLGLAAANQGGEGVVRLLAAGADPNLATPEGQTPLMTAARTGEARSVAALLDRGAEIDRRERWFGETALMWAAAENHAEATAVLVSRGADLNARTPPVQLPNVKVDAATMVFTALPKGGMTPLLLAAREGALESARVLVTAGADLNLADPDGTSPLVMAVINAHYGVAAMLAEAGADASVADTAGMGAVYALVDMRTQGPLINRPLPTPTGGVESLDLLTRLLDRGADPDLPLTSPLLMRQHNGGDGALGRGATALMRAAKSGDVAAMRVLVAHGADPARAAGDGSTAAMFAARRAGRPRPSLEDTIAALRLCLDAGADINAGDKTGQTLLHIAVGSGDELVQMLADAGADLAARDAAGRTPLDVALGKPGPAVVGRGGRAVQPEPGPVRETTAALLRELMRARGVPIEAEPPARAIGPGK